MQTTSRKLNITVGANRKSKHWAKKSLSWYALKEKLSSFIVTKESVVEWKASTKEQKSLIKDVGGFVGGLFEGTRRQKHRVVSRSLIALDLDNLKVSDVKVVQYRLHELGIYFLAHSTHSHSPDSPRLRIFCPLDRDVSAEEYGAISRKLAEHVGMAYMDPSTFEVSRLMYWPSRSSDAEELCFSGGKDYIHVEQWLSSYSDWRNLDTWPKHPKEETRLKTLVDRAKTQQDPREKEGLVGCFCRTYTISEAIAKFLPNTYLSYGEGRYTYSEGSSLGGAVVYDDLFLYSHHATDPAGQTLCNAFDLVRLHRFSDLDTEEQPKASYSEMIKFAQMDEDTRKTYFEEGTQKTLDHLFIEGLDGDSITKTKETLALDSRGHVKQTIDNVYKVLKLDANLKGRFRYDTFTCRQQVTAPLPWRLEHTENRYWDNMDDSGLFKYLEDAYDLKGKSNIEHAFTLASQEDLYSEPRALLESLSWDGTSRAETLFIDFFGAENNIYIRTLGKILVSAIAGRILCPGLPFDLMIILSGGQGIGKSTFTAKMGKKWYTDSLLSMKEKDDFETVLGKVIVEDAELRAMKASGYLVAKNFITKRADEFRAAYAKKAEIHKRTAILIGTTNENDYLQDDSGNRRFAPVDVRVEHCQKSIFEDLTEDYVNQLWAEGYVLFMNGEKLYLEGEAKRISEEEQELHEKKHDLEGVIEAALEEDYPVGWLNQTREEKELYRMNKLSYKGEKEKLTYVCVAMVWEDFLERPLNFLDRKKSFEIASILNKLKGWKAVKKLKRFKAFGVQRAWERNP